MRWNNLLLLSSVKNEYNGVRILRAIGDKTEKTGLSSAILLPLSNYSVLLPRSKYRCQITAVKPQLVVNAAIPWITVDFGHRGHSYHANVDLL